MDGVLVWSGVIGGALIGLYVIFQHWMSGRMLGISSGFCNLITPCSRLSFFKQGEHAEFNTWRLWFLLGLPIGSFIAAITTPGFEWQITLDMGRYDEILSSNLWLKLPALFFGGVIMGLGARMAGGCTSGHAISGIALLNPPSMLAAVLFFLSGLAFVQLAMLIVG